MFFLKKSKLKEIIPISSIISAQFCLLDSYLTRLNKSVDSIIGQNGTFYRVNPKDFRGYWVVISHLNYYAFKSFFVIHPFLTNKIFNANYYNFFLNFTINLSNNAFNTKNFTCLNLTKKFMLFLIVNWFRTKHV